MRTRTKILITILLALLWCAFLQGQDTALTNNQKQALLQEAYAENNDDFFLGQLPKDARIEWTAGLRNENGHRAMGLTIMNEQGQFIIKIDRESNAVMRVAKFTLIHEECHVKLWTKEFDDHGFKFQSCMLDIAARGGFHDLC
jgi:hypothetical protein